MNNVTPMLDLSKLFRQPYVTMFESTCSFKECHYALFGVPFDATSTWRRGSRYGPMELRRVSTAVETYSMRFGMPVEEVPLCDLGDLKNLDNVKEMVKAVLTVCSRLKEAGKVPVAIGGEHTLTLGTVSALKPDAVVYMDAHLDLRDEYMGIRLSHTTFMRRLAESMKIDFVAVGTRAVCKEELEYAFKRGVKIISSADIRKIGVQKASKELRESLSEVDSLYISVDLDVLDPAYAPAVGNPEACGLETWIVLELLSSILDDRVVGLDLCEYAPPYDNNSTAAQALKILSESLIALEVCRCSGRKVSGT